jgi:hypothetical protein
MKKEGESTSTDAQLSTVLASSLFEQKEPVGTRSGSLSRDLELFGYRSARKKGDRPTSLGSRRWSALWFGSSVGVFVSSLLFWFLVVQVTIMTQVVGEYSKDGGYVDAAAAVFNQNDAQLARVAQMIEVDKANILTAGCTSARLELNSAIAPPVVFASLSTKPEYRLYRMQSHEGFATYNQVVSDLRKLDEKVHQQSLITIARTQLQDIQVVRTICAVLEKPDVTAADIGILCTQLRDGRPIQSPQLLSVLTTKLASICAPGTTPTIAQTQSVMDGVLRALANQVVLSPASDEVKERVQQITDQAKQDLTSQIQSRQQLPQAVYIPDDFLTP